MPPLTTGLNCAQWAVFSGTVHSLQGWRFPSVFPDRPAGTRTSGVLVESEASGNSSALEEDLHLGPVDNSVLCVSEPGGSKKLPLLTNKGNYVVCLGVPAYLHIATSGTFGHTHIIVMVTCLSAVALAHMTAKCWLDNLSRYIKNGVVICHNWMVK